MKIYRLQTPTPIPPKLNRFFIATKSNTENCLKSCNVREIQAAEDEKKIKWKLIQLIIQQQQQQKTESSDVANSLLPFFCNGL